MRRRSKPRLGGWFMVVATVLVLALLGLVGAGVVAYISHEDDDEPADRPSPAKIASAADEDAATAARARAFYERLVERRLGEAASLAVGDALAQVQALSAGGQVAADPVQAEVIDDTVRGRLEEFELTGPVRQTGLATRELDARAVVYLAEQRRTVRIWFALRRAFGGWRVENYRPQAEPSP